MGPLFKTRHCESSSLLFLLRVPDKTAITDSMATNGVTNGVPVEEGILPIEPHQTFDTILVLDFG
jgi:hypothetical protein